MTLEWKRLSDDEPPLWLRSEATDRDEVVETFAELIRYMASRAQEDGADDRAALFMFVNATNGYTRSCWVDESNKAVGTWGYRVDLPNVWEESLEHDDGAFYFDDICRRALQDAAESAPAMSEGLGLRFRTELGGLEEF